MLANLVHLAKPAYETERVAMHPARLFAHLGSAALSVGVGTVVLLFVRKLSTVPRLPLRVLRHPLVRDLAWCVRAFWPFLDLFGYSLRSRTYHIRLILREKDKKQMIP